MNAYILFAILVGPHEHAPPSHRAVIVYDSDFHSTALRSEWNRQWKLTPYRQVIEGDFVVKWVDNIDMDRRVPTVPCVILEREVIPLTACSSSGAALTELYDALNAYQVEIPLDDYWYPED